MEKLPASSQREKNPYFYSYEILSGYANFLILPIPSDEVIVISQKTGKVVSRMNLNFAN